MHIQSRWWIKLNEEISEVKTSEVTTLIGVISSVFWIFPDMIYYWDLFIYYCIQLIFNTKSKSKLSGMYDEIELKSWQLEKNTNFNHFPVNLFRIATNILFCIKMAINHVHLML